MNIRSPKRLAAKILVLFMALSVVPALFFGARLVLMASSHLDKDVNVWTKLDPAYAEHARTFHDSMKERLRKEIASFALYGSFIAAAAALFASGLLLRPLRKLTEGVRHIGSGNLHYRLPVQGNDEIAALSRAFNAMADSLQKRNDELGRKELYIEKMLDPMWVLDAGNRIFDVNPAFTRLFGHRKDEVVGRDAREFFDSANLPVFDLQMREKRERGFADVYELSIVCRRGNNIPVLVSCSPIMENGRAVGEIGVFKDISMRKELEDDVVQKNKELYALNTIAAITSHSLDLVEILRNTVKEATAITGMDAGGIYIADHETRELTCAGHVGVPEQFVARMESFKFGEDLPGLVVITGDTVAISNVSRDPRIFRHSVKETGMKGYLCLPLKSKDKVQGVLCMLSIEEHLFTSSELEFLESVGHIVGVAIENVKFYTRERSRLTGLVDLEKNRAEAILSSITEGVYTTDRDLRITYWNRAAEEITGFRACDVVGRTCREVLGHEDEQGERLCQDRCVMRRGNNGGEALHVLCPTAGGEKLPTALTSAPIRDASGEETGRVNVFRDITRAKEIDRMKTDFVRTVSHELRTPLSAIVGMTEMLMDGEIREDEAAQEYLETIHTEGQRLASMVEELLDIARIESGRQEIRKQSVTVQPVVENCINLLKGRIAAKNITVTWQGPSGLPPVSADREKLHQVVFNLLNNALCYSDDGASVTIHGARREDALALTFEDTGWGIPEQDLPHIFKKFYRSKPHARRVKGTGLGLPLVLEIVKSHGGSIDVQSAPAKGSTFTVTLPLAEGEMKKRDNGSENGRIGA